MTEKTEVPEEEAVTAKTAAPKAGEKGPEKASEKGNEKGNGKIWMGTAVGVGSAALVAALMYAKRRK